MDDPKQTPLLIERFGPQPPEILGELHSMLRLYDVDAQELFFKWESYSMRMELTADTKLSIDVIRRFKQDAQERLEKELRGKARMQQTPAVQRTVRPPPQGADSFSLFDGMLPTTPARGAIKRNNLGNETPRTGKPSRKLDNLSSPAAAASPYRTPHKPSAPAVEAITPFRQRNHAGETTEVLNPRIPKPTLPLADATWSSRVDFMFNMDIQLFRYRPMYQKLSEASETQDERIDEFAAAIQEHYSLPDEAFGDPSVASPAEIVAVGRIVSDSLEGKFNASSILLESSRMTGAGARIPLKLQKISSFAFFPGQILAVKGVNSSGGYFQVQEILEPPKLPPASTLVSNLMAYAKRLEAGPVSVFIASGPYTTNDNLDFEALEELCTKCAEQQPDVVILTGPFIDSAHPLIQTGDFDLEDGNEDGTIEDLFRQKISRKLQRITNSLIILIPSVRDAVSKHTAFPQEGLKRKHLDLPTNAKCLPNPSMFSLNETLFAVTTNDILFHLKCEEITQNAGSEPFARLSTHLLTQRSFYPLFPPPPRESLPAGLKAVGASLDVPNMRLADLVNVTPDVLVVPSMLGTFAKVVDGVVVVNPGNACKPRGAGTFAEFVILPKRVEEEGKMDETVGHAVWDRARVDVKRI